MRATRESGSEGEGWRNGERGMEESEGGSLAGCTGNERS